MVIHILADMDGDILSLLIYVFIVGNKVHEFLLTEHYIFITNQVKLANTVGWSWINFSGEGKKHMLWKSPIPPSFQLFTHEEWGFIKTNFNYLLNMDKIHVYQAFYSRK